MGKSEYLWRMVNEHMTQARQQETLRSSVTTLIFSLSGGMLALLALNKGQSYADLLLSILIIFLGVFGICFSAKHYERFNHHIARVKFYRNELEKYFPDTDWKLLRERADTYHNDEYKFWHDKRQHRFWYILHSFNIAFGIAATVFIVIATCHKDELSEAAPSLNCKYSFSHSYFCSPYLQSPASPRGH